MLVIKKTEDDNLSLIHFGPYPSSTLADPRTSRPPDLPLAHRHSCANRYAKTIRSLAYNYRYNIHNIHVHIM